MRRPIARLTRPHEVAAFAVAILGLSGCHLEGRSHRAETLLAQLAPTLQLGESLREARRAVPSLRVRHPGDSTDMEFPDGATSPKPVAVIVAPAPASQERAAPDAIVDGVEFIMPPEVASRLRQQISTLFRRPGSMVCATRAIASSDSIVQWELDRRGGALLTFPEHRVDGTPPVSRLFVYTGGWQPSASLAGYRAAPCEASS